MWLNIVLIITGLILLQQGAAFFVRGSSGLARKFHVSELAIGLTIVAFGTPPRLNWLSTVLLLLKITTT